MWENVKVGAGEPDVDFYEDCESCTDGEADCDTCGGTGKVDDEDHEDGESDCEECEGTGTVDCQECDGGKTDVVNEEWVEQARDALQGAIDELMI